MTSFNLKPPSKGCVSKYSRVLWSWALGLQPMNAGGHVPTTVAYRQGAFNRAAAGNGLFCRLKITLCLV